MSISTSSILVELNISAWTAKKLDRGVSDEIDVSKQTTVKAGNYNKNLLAGSLALDNIHKFISRFRLWHLQQTLPWSDNGTRLLPMKHFLDYKAGLATREQMLKDMWENFFNDYPNLVSQSVVRLGAMANLDEYPSVDDVRTKFKMTCNFAPVPEAGDFRIDTGNNTLRELEASYQNVYEQKVAAAMQEQWNRLHETLTHMQERMTDKVIEGGDTKRKGFHSTLLENAAELCGLLTKFNVTNDPKLEEARQDLERALSGMTVDTLKESDEARASMKAKVDNILKKFEW